MPQRKTSRDESIMADLASGASYNEIALRYGISRARAGQIWKKQWVRRGCDWPVKVSGKRIELPPLPPLAVQKFNECVFREKHRCASTTRSSAASAS